MAATNTTTTPLLQYLRGVDPCAIAVHSDVLSICYEDEEVEVPSSAWQWWLRRNDRVQLSKIVAAKGALLFSTVILCSRRAPELLGWPSTFASSSVTFLQYLLTGDLEDQNAILHTLIDAMMSDAQQEQEKQQPAPDRRVLLVYDEDGPTTGSSNDASLSASALASASSSALASSSLPCSVASLQDFLPFRQRILDMLPANAVLTLGVIAKSVVQAASEEQYSMKMLPFSLLFPLADSDCVGGEIAWAYRTFLRGKLCGWMKTSSGRCGGIELAARVKQAWSERPAISQVPPPVSWDNFRDSYVQTKECAFLNEKLRPRLGGSVGGGVDVGYVVPPCVRLNCMVMQWRLRYSSLLLSVWREEEQHYAHALTYQERETLLKHFENELKLSVATSSVSTSASGSILPVPRFAEKQTIVTAPRRFVHMAEPEPADLWNLCLHESDGELHEEDYLAFQDYLCDVMSPMVEKALSEPISPLRHLWNGDWADEWKIECQRRFSAVLPRQINSQPASASAASAETKHLCVRPDDEKAADMSSDAMQISGATTPIGSTSTSSSTASLAKPNLMVQAFNSQLEYCREVESLYHANRASVRQFWDQLQRGVISRIEKSHGKLFVEAAHHSRHKSISTSPVSTANSGGDRPVRLDVQTHAHWSEIVHASQAAASAASAAADPSLARSSIICDGCDWMGTYVTSLGAIQNCPRCDSDRFNGHWMHNATKVAP